MKYSILASGVLFVALVFIYLNDLPNGEIPTLFINSISKESNQNIPGNIRIQPGQSPNETRPNEIRQELYDSISIGMTYEEVIAIIGWDGVLIYENNIDTAEGKIHEQVYQWNNQDIYRSSNDEHKLGDRSIYGSIKLRFQNHILVNKSFVILKP
ncbi:hypothetical protein CLI64_00995 [Nostoc sp. CENA543]|uniref:hypothetical protein n=1 Tax=Nostoc sp. CENA543 TaxID=1869241 RepID=UPI000CA309DD|nr:hypothetical protein [Nostoc sp. CENA543]AUS99089.1 hypothetical protein CLI64_00995 [Nostoc sp. CENA543]